MVTLPDGTPKPAGFDGAVMPAALGDVSGLPALLAALREAGFGDADLAKVAHANWRRVLAATWAT